MSAVQKLLPKINQKALPGATRMSLNRSLSALQTRANKKTREERRMKARDIKKDFFTLVRARGSDFARLNAQLIVSNKVLSLIRFIVGPREGRSQKGIPVRKRKPVTVHVRPGRRVKLKGAFVAKGRGGNNQIFRRRTKKSTPIVKQSVPSLASLFNRPKFRVPLETFAQQRFEIEFNRAFEFQLNKLVKK